MLARVRRSPRPPRRASSAVVNLAMASALGVSPDQPIARSLDKVVVTASGQECGLAATSTKPLDQQ